MHSIPVGAGVPVPTLLNLGLSLRWKGEALSLRQPTQTHSKLWKDTPQLHLGQCGKDHRCLLQRGWAVDGLQRAHQLLLWRGKQTDSGAPLNPSFCCFGV